MNHVPISAEEERIARAIVDAAYAVHSTLGPGLLEMVYEVCFCHELAKRGLSHRRQVVVPIVYDGITFDEGLRIEGGGDDASRVYGSNLDPVEANRKAAWLSDQL
jgi:hypothetical protein